MRWQKGIDQFESVLKNTKLKLPPFTTVIVICNRHQVKWKDYQVSVAKTSSFKNYETEIGTEIGRTPYVVRPSQGKLSRNR
jgi:hypothetical protein